MSRKNLCQICHKKHLTNKCFSKNIVLALRKNGLNVKDVAFDLKINLERVRNWYYKDTGIVAYDLWSLIKHYHFLRRIITTEINATPAKK